MPHAAQLKTDIVFAIEAFDAYYADARALLEMHYDEIAPYKDLLKLSPDVPRYKAMDKNGQLFIATVRDAGALVGYISVFVTPHLHYSDVLTATDDVHFIHPDYRGGQVATRLLRFAEDEARRRGVQIMALRTKVAHNHGVLFERLGYSALDVVYTKRL